MDNAADGLMFQPILPEDRASDAVLSAEFPRLHQRFMFTGRELDELGGLDLLNRANDDELAPRQLGSQLQANCFRRMIVCAFHYLQDAARSFNAGASSWCSCCP